MNELIVICLFFFLAVRILGFFVSLDLYYSKKEIKFVMFTLSWILFVIGNLFAIFVNIDQQHNLRILFLFINAGFVQIATIVYLWAFGKYYASIPNKIMILFTTIIVILILIIFALSDILIIVIILGLLIHGIIVSIYTIPIFSKNFKEKMGNSIRWYYPAVISFFLYFPIFTFSLLQGYGYGVYNTEDLTIIIINYLPAVFGQILWILILIHLEYKISDNKKNNLKDKYSHNLGNIMQSIYSAHDLIYKSKISKEKTTELEDLIETKINEASELIREIRKL